MAVNDRALFLYGFDINAFNQYINFKSSSLGPVLTATLTPGNYTATEFMAEIKSAMEIADTLYAASTFTLSLNRTVGGGLSNVMTISTNKPFLSLLFGSGPNAATNPSSLMGLSNSDYTGATSYAGSTNAGTILVPDFPTYNYLDPDSYVTNDGVKNVSSAGIKETLVFTQMQFFQGQWKYINNFKTNTQLSQWQNFLKYAVKQLKFEFQPSVFEDPTVFFQCTLESTGGDGNGMGYKLNQMLGDGLYRFYDTGLMKFRINNF